MDSTAAPQRNRRQVGIALGPALVTVSWALSGEGIAAMRLPIGLAAALAAASALALAWRGSPRVTTSPESPSTERTPA